jgi:hypothetical protein
MAQALIDSHPPPILRGLGVNGKIIVIGAYHEPFEGPIAL